MDEDSLGEQAIEVTSSQDMKLHVSVEEDRNYEQNITQSMSEESIAKFRKHYTNISESPRNFLRKTRVMIDLGKGRKSFSKVNIITFLLYSLVYLFFPLHKHI